MIQEKECPRCGVTKSASGFYLCRSRKDGLQGYCKECRHEIALENKERLNDYHKQYRRSPKYKKWLTAYEKKNKARRKVVNAKSKLKLKVEVFNHYGGARCSCCGEKEIAFLVIDHINGGGTKHRKALGMSGDTLYRWLKKNSYPGGYRVLCQNCNWGMFVGKGVCPHQKS